MATKESVHTRSWSKDSFFISTNVDLLPVSELNDVFASDDFYWAKSLPEETMKEMLKNSLCFGVYEQTSSSIDEQSRKSSETFIGFARCVTDFVTFVYLTDVWINPAYQGRGLGRWLIGCIRETVEQMPHLRRTLLCTGDWERSVPFYERELNMTLMQSKKGSGLAVMECKGRGHPSYGEGGSGY